MDRNPIASKHSNGGTRYVQPHPVNGKSAGNAPSKHGHDDHALRDPDVRSSMQLGWHVEPWDKPVSAAELLDELTKTVRRHLVLPPESADAVALWTLFTHVHDCFAISPLLAITSPTPECGKSTLLTILGCLVPRPLPTSNITAAALFHSIQKWTPTLLIDEGDTFISASKQLQGILNSGHLQRSAFVTRLSRESGQPERFCTWSPKAIALIGELPSTLASRAIHIELMRKAADEYVEPLRLDKLNHLTPLMRQAARWADDNFETVKSIDPELPSSLQGRAADNWRPLLSIARAAGGAWPERARCAAERLSAKRRDEVPGELLIQDISTVFRSMELERITSADLAARLGRMEHRPWPEWKACRPITPRQVAQLLKPFGVRPVTIRIGTQTAKGYMKSDFSDAFCRYAPDQSVTS